MDVPGEPLPAQADGGWCLPQPAACAAAHMRCMVRPSLRRDDGRLGIDGHLIDTWPIAHDSALRAACPPGAAPQGMRTPGQAEPPSRWRLQVPIDTGGPCRREGPVIPRQRAH